MSAPTRLGDTLSFRALRAEADRRSVGLMTTNEARQYRILQLTAGIIEDTAIGHEAEVGFDAQAAATEYVRNTLDNGPSSDPEVDNAPVWELMALLGFDPEAFDPFEVFAVIAPLIEACDFFND